MKIFKIYARKKLHPIYGRQKSKPSVLLNAIIEGRLAQLRPDLSYYKDDEIKAAEEELDFRLRELK